jgi:uncharacterized damage-inducible protein DinB
MNAAVTFDELLRQNEEETERWHQWFRAHPGALDLKMEIAQMHDVRGVLVHIFAVESLYTERILGQSRPGVSPADFPSSSVDELFGIGQKARAKFREFLQTWSDADWNQAVTFQTLSAGSQSASRRKCFTHALLHSMRHWAQLATALRQQGLKQDWGHDFLFSKAMS